MKYALFEGKGVQVRSLPVRGAWIEMRSCTMALALMSSLPVRGAWIEILRRRSHPLYSASLPVRGAWIEIQSGVLSMGFTKVAPRAGSVD